MQASRLPVEQLSLTFRAEAPAAARAALPGGWWFWCLLGIGIGIGGWLVSRHYLAQRLGEQLLSARSRGEAVTAIEGLILLDSATSSRIVSGLQNEDFYIARTAFRTIEAQVTRWQKLKATERNLRLKNLAQSLNSLPATIPPDNQILASSLASRIFTICLESDDSGMLDVMELCETQIQRAGQRLEKYPEQNLDEGNSPDSIALALPVANAQPVASVTSINDSQYTSLVSPPPPLPPEIVNVPNIRLTDTSEDEARLTSDRISSESSTFPTEVANSSGGRGNSLQLVVAPLRSSMQLTDRDENEALNVNITSIADDSPQTDPNSYVDSQPTPTLAGTDQLPIKELVRLLASVQPKISQAAALALRRHGMSDENLELAMQLATGTEGRRIEIIEQLATRTDLDPRVWLLWMAQDGQPAVRARAIGELSSMLDLDVMRELRQQLNRERDPQVAQLIRRVLMTP